jgi:DNA-binding NarL/FixJ family response regulator
MNKRIAVIDDQAMFRKSLITLINCFSDCKVILDASDGIEMIKAIDSTNLPDIVLMDIVMPNMDGYEATLWLKENYPQVKVLALSTVSNEQTITKMIRQGARGYILKDADPSELRQAFQEIEQIGYFYNENVSRELIKVMKRLEENTFSPSNLKVTPREMVFLNLACSDRSYQQIADEMDVTMRTVDGYRDTLFRRFDVASRVGMVLFALRKGIIHL